MYIICDDFLACKMCTEHWILY